ncbi:MAG TPA: hypothetical protein VN903_15315 [Polyangia bacterium]|jgi:hypothetical protein|nr:hypothetical protein [Polyangia bacterium]
MSRILYALVVIAVLCSCGDGTSEAIKRGVGSECSDMVKCSEADQVCLTAFKGGYCGRADCVHDTDCPAGSACVTADNGMNYCFLICADKPDCNVRRSLDNESNCTSSLAFADGTKDRKVCNPPSSGI